MTIWRLRVDGQPAPKGSMVCLGQRGKVRHQMVEDDARGTRKRWRKLLTTAAQVLAGQLPDGGEGGVIVGLLALLPRESEPAQARLLPTTRDAGDVDKHLRMTLDSLDGAEVFRDDSRVALTLSAKAFADDGRPGAIVYLAPIGEDPHRILTAMLTEAPALTGTDPRHLI